MFYTQDITLKWNKYTAWKTFVVNSEMLYQSVLNHLQPLQPC